MRILVVVHGFPPSAQGGSEIYAHAHALALRREYGDEILVLTREQDPRRPEYDVRTERRDGLQIAWVNNTFRDVRSFDESYVNPTVGRIAASLIDEFAPDVAHIHHLTCLSTTIVRSLADRRIPRIVTLHDYWFICHRGQLLDVNYRVCAGPEPSGCHACLGPAAGAGSAAFIGAAAVRAVERQLPEASARQLRQAAERVSAIASSSSESENQARLRLEHMREVCSDVTAFIAPSRSMRDRFVQFGVDPNRIIVAGYGFDHEGRVGRVGQVGQVGQVGSARGRPLRAGFLGSLMVSKAPHVLLEAAARLPRGAVSVDLFGAHCAYHGDDSYRRALEPLLNREGVTAHGALAHGDVPQALASLDVLVVPSVWPENSPLVIQEAFLAGVPVVASRTGGIPEAVADGANGLLFAPGDAEDLARALARLIDEPDLLATLRAGIPPVRSIEEDVAASRRLYQEHLSRDSSSRPRLAAVVLNFRTPDETLLTVRSLLASRRKIDDIIVVNNDAIDDARAAVESVRSSFAKATADRSNIVYVHTGRNLGFSGGVNVGIREALSRGAARVLLVNSDLIVPPECIERLEHSLEDPGAGIAGPIVLSRSAPDRIASAGMRYAPASGRMRHLRVGESIDGCDLPVSARVDGVSGCLMLVKREVFDRAGLLEEDYFFSFEDLDFCLKARRAGFATIVSGTARAYHEGGRSIGAGSPRRLYFGARNQLLMGHRAQPGDGRLRSFARGCSIVALNLAHAVISNGGPLSARLAAVARGTRDYISGRFGDDLM